MMEFYFGLWYIFSERVIVLEIKTGYIYHIKDDFFDKIYSAYKIKRVEATRMINCNGKSRGKIKELLISNF